ncbi:hypothetical protein [Nocardioides conyzicola]|uniref:Uncharacterized protein n=1 Tax=Nocardioides conyzicola TaxID=1651781 RepID=A0ABP8WL01_9ACTN
MHRLALAVVAVLVACSGLAVAPATAAGVYKVTLASSRSVADVGQVTVLTGKVSGRGAGKKKVGVDVSTDGSAWKRLGTTTTTKTGKYTYKAKVASAGTTSYRVVVPRSKTVGKGTSKTVALQSWRWLDLYDQPYLTGGGVVGRGAYETTTIGGGKPPAHTFAMGESSYLYWNLAQQCDQVVAQVGLGDGDQGETRTVRFEQSGDTTDVAVTGGEALKGFADLDASAANSLFVSRPDDRYAFLVLPRAHCKVNTLPVAAD